MRGALTSILRRGNRHPAGLTCPATKYAYDMSSMREDILALREPIFAVRPRTAFGLDEHATLKTATRWRFGP